MSRAPADIPIELWRRPAVTAAALACYVLAWNIPVPGLDLAKLAPLHSAGLDTTKLLSIAALGVTPLFTALVLAELLEVMVPRLRAGDAEPWRETQNALVLTLGLLVAGIHGAGYARSLEGVEGLVAEPGLTFRIAATATVVAATAFVAWLADQMTRHGLGSGFWVLLAAPAIGDVCPSIARSALLFETGELAGTAIALYTAYIVASVGAVVALEWGRFSRDEATMSSCLWPMVLAFFVFHWSPYVVLLVGSQEAWVAYQQLITPGGPLPMLVLAVLVAGFAVVYAWSRAGTSEAAQPGRDPPTAVVAAALTAIALAGELVRAHLQVPLAFDGRSIVIVTVLALSILSASRRIAPLVELE